MKVQITDTVYMKAEPTISKNYPGIWIQVYDGSKEIASVLVDKTDDEIIGRFWDSENIEEDPVVKTTLAIINDKFN